MLPHDFPKWKTVYHYFRLWRLNGTWERINASLRTELRTAEDRNPEPSAAVLGKAKGKFPRLQLIWADGGYAGKLIGWVKQFCGWMLEIVKRSDDIKGFQILPHRWVVKGHLADSTAIGG